MFNFFKKSSLIKILPKAKGTYSTNVKLAKYTWFGVGGNAEVLFEPKDADDLANFIKNKPNNVPVFLIGGGSNLLIRDGGIMGVVIKLSSPFFKQVKVSEDEITCYAGLPNAQLKKILVENNIADLGFLCSIPGVIGGSIKTNAGCFGFEIKDFITKATIINELGEKQEIDAKDLKLEYRSSMFPESWIITSVSFKYTKKSKEEIIKTIEENKAYRKKNQPHNVKTAGSTFKNPKGTTAWKLIKKAGCDNLKIGGAKVSEKHCNFLINTGNATAQDIENLGEKIIKNVKKETGITLEWEVKRVGVKK